MSKLPVPLSFDWDQGNIDKNWKKHKVHYKESEEIFLNKHLKTYRNIKHSHKEKRLSALGVTNKGRYLYISFTIRSNKIRIISARDQSKKERRLYAKEKSK
jgi:uncharacterized DUF497 family protein